MMRGWTPLYATLALLIAAGAAHAQETSPDEPMPPCCTQAPPPVVVCCSEAPDRPRKLLLKLSVGPQYRYAFDEDFFAALPELEIGGQTRNFSVGARISAALGATRVGLPYQFLNIGPSFMFRLSPRVMLGLGGLFGFMLYERATASAESVVYSPTLGGVIEATVDVARTHAGGAVYLDARLEADWIATLHGNGVGSVAPSFSLGWRL